jgi:hypothetical protein
MAKKREKEPEIVIPPVCYCKKCKNGGRIEDFKVLCKVQNIWQHSPHNCKYYIEK